MVRRSMLKKLAALATLAACGPAMAQGEPWPSKPIRFVVPFPAGTGGDVVARILSDQLGRRLGQSVVVENRVGAAGMIGTENVARSPADGYSVLLSVNSIMTMNPHVYKKIGYDPVADFAGVMQLTSASYVLVAGPNYEAKTLSELLALAKARPDKVEYASLGVGSATHVLMEHLSALANVKMFHVPFKTTGLTEVMAGQIPVAFEPIATAIPAIQTGKVRALAVTSPTRSSQLPDTPAVSELLPGFSGDGWHGVSVPAKTPRPVVERLHKELAQIMALPEIRSRFAGLGLTIVAGTPAELDAKVKSDLDKWGRVIRAARIAID